MNNKQKVILLTATDPYRDIRAIKVSNSLYEAGYDVSIVGGYSNNKFMKEMPFRVYDYNIPYNDLENIRKKVLWKLKFFIYAKKIIKNSKPNIIHACNIDMLVLAYLYGFKKAKIIYDSYEICAQKSGVSGDSKFFSKLIVIIEKYLLKKINYMICVSNAARNYFLNIYKIKNIEVITNVPKVKINLESKISQKLKIILYIGGFSFNRGIEELILSGKYMNPNFFRINIQGFGEYGNELHKIIEDHHLNHIVHFLPAITPEEIVQTISKNADIGIVLTKPTSLNHKYTVSNKIFDYINAGLPVIMSNVDEHKYLNSKYNFGIIIEDVTPENIYNAVLQLSDENLYNYLSENCIKAAKKLNWDIEQQKLLKIYQNL